jgi:hypothetical protein
MWNILTLVLGRTVFYNTTDRIAKNELLGLYYNYIFYILCADPINIEEVAEGYTAPII